MNACSAINVADFHRKISLMLSIMSSYYHIFSSFLIVCSLLTIVFPG